MTEHAIQETECGTLRSRARKALELETHLEGELGGLVTNEECVLGMLEDGASDGHSRADPIESHDIVEENPMM